MKRILLALLAFSLIAGTISTAGAQDLAGTWTLRIQNLDRKEMASATIRFTQDTARSCMSGAWKRVAVDPPKTSDKSFFPLSDPLSYTLEDGEVIIGRNELCDGYLRLRGKFDKREVQGEYYAFGMRGSTPLGYFSLVRNP